MILEDDGRVAYAYLRDGAEIVSDVWLYNVGANPSVVEWRDRSQMPFQNPASYCGDEALARLHAAVEVSCIWSPDSVEVSVDGAAWAVLEKGMRPGWSRNARVSGPLARCMSERRR